MELHQSFRDSLPKMGIYAITNLLNGRRYIGSSKNLKERRSNHLLMLRTGTHYTSYLLHAWNKYGSLAFSFSVVEEVQNEKDLLVREQFYLDTLENLYNLNKTACKPPTRTGPMPQSQKDKIRIANTGQSRPSKKKGKKYSLEQLACLHATLASRPITQKQIEGQAKNRAWHFARRGQKKDPAIVEKSASKIRGIKHPPEVVEKRAAANRGKKRTPEQNARNSAAQKLVQQRRREQKWQEEKQQSNPQETLQP